MNKKQLTDKINQTSAELCRLQNDLCAAERTDVALYPENFSELAADAALRSERITCALRQLACLIPASRVTYLAKAASAQGITIKEDAGVLTVTLPGLIPKRKAKAKCDFLIDPLLYAVSEYAMTHPVCRHEHSAICFFHIYDQQIHDCNRDYDNLECKQVLDAVALFFLPDDRGACCDVYHTSLPGAADETHIHILEAERFPTWLAEQNPI